MTSIRCLCHTVKVTCDMCGCQVLTTLPAEEQPSADDTRLVAQDVIAWLERGGWRKDNGAHYCPFCRPPLPTP